MSAFDAERYRDISQDRWERAAAGWGQRRAQLQAAAAPVSHWLVEAIRPQPGHTVLELAAGPGDTGMLAAELVAPGGTLICSDVAEAMLDVARARARELGLDNVDFRKLNAESIDLDAASVDAVLCRWGYMLLADPAAALRETRRVLRPGGRVALAAWDMAQHNPWATVPDEEIQRVVGRAEPEPGQPGMFAFARPGRIEELLHDTGFSEVEVDVVEFQFAFADLDEWWEDRLALSTLADTLADLEQAQRARVRTAIDDRLAQFAGSDGSLRMPARALVAAATA
jgi:ubiquinone/menaquinone biosynthesis C-methylase UbiE